MLNWPGRNAGRAGAASSVSVTTSLDSRLTDKTWTGVLPAPPSECLLFVDFASADVAERAERILGGPVGKELAMTLSHRGHETAQLVASFGTVDADFFADGAPAAKKAADVFHELGAKTQARDAKPASS